MVKFPYREEGNPPILRPTVDVRLACEPNGEWTTRALIDTGSPLTVFDRGVAEALCLRIGHLGAETGTIALLGATRRIQPPAFSLSPELGRCRILHGGELGFLGFVPGSG